MIRHTALRGPAHGIARSAGPEGAEVYAQKRKERKEGKDEDEDSMRNSSGFNEVLMRCE